MKIFPLPHAKKTRDLSGSRMRKGYQRQAALRGARDPGTETETLEHHAKDHSVRMLLRCMLQR